jgi:UDP-3-O-[3-hydroxymyristoyl] glucosamine N-acyltransferase
VGDGTRSIQSARPVTEAGPGDITFIENERYAKYLRTSPASAAIVGPHFHRARPAGSESESDREADSKVEEVLDPSIAVIEVDDPMSAFLKVRDHLVGGPKARWTGVHPMAWVSPTATLGRDVAVYPFAFVGDGAVVGDGTTIHPGAVVSDGCQIGRDCTLHANAVLYADTVLGDRVEIHAGSVLGGDGFGYRRVEGRHVKIPHTGRVEIGDDVEIGANCAIDRATFESTRIGEGTKIDNLVMIGHNNRIGRHNLLCGQVGLAGSCSTGDHVILAGQAGIKDNTTIGDGSIVGAQAGVHRNVPSGQQVLGSPAIPVREQRRIFQMSARLPDMHRQLRELSAQVARLTEALAQQTSGASEIHAVGSAGIGEPLVAPGSSPLSTQDNEAPVGF